MECVNFINLFHDKLLDKGKYQRSQKSHPAISAISLIFSLSTLYKSEIR